MVSCVACCAPFSLTAGIILYIFGFLMNNGNVSLALVGAVKEWDMKEKSRACYTAGSVYMAISVICWFAIHMRRHRLRAQLRRQLAETERTALLGPRSPIIRL